MDGDNLKHFSINIVYTPNYGLSLVENASLRSRLLEIPSCIQVNVLINGKESEDLRLKDDAALFKRVRIVDSLQDRVTLGQARWILHNNTLTKWYMNLDEDDTLLSPESWLSKLNSIIPRIKTPTAFFSTLVVSPTETYILQDDTEAKIGPLSPNLAKVNCGAIYNKDLLDEHGFWRPWLNGCEDDLFYMYLCSEFKDTTYIKNLTIYQYNVTHSVMSKGLDTDPNKRDLNYVSDFGYNAFRMNLIEIISL